MKTPIKVGSVLMEGGAPHLTADVTHIDKVAGMATLEWSDKLRKQQTVPLATAQAMAPGGQMKRFHEAQSAKSAKADADRQDDLARYGDGQDGDHLNP